MRSYMNVDQDLILYFEECNFNMIPILKNCIVDSLDTSGVVFKVCMHSSGRYEVEVRHMPSVLDNVKGWKFVEYDK